MEENQSVCESFIKTTEEKEEEKYEKSEKEWEIIKSPSVIC